MVGKAVRQERWETMKDAGVDIIPRYAAPPQTAEKVDKLSTAVISPFTTTFLTTRTTSGWSRRGTPPRVFHPSTHTSVSFSYFWSGYSDTVSYGPWSPGQGEGYRRGRLRDGQIVGQLRSSKFPADVVQFRLQLPHRQGRPLPNDSLQAALQPGS